MKAATKRFYDKVSVRALEGSLGWTVALDGKGLLTPAKHVMALRTEELALGIASEWDAQGAQLRPDTMPLMKLATTSIDQVPDIRPTMVDSMLRCLNSDLACFRSTEEPGLVAREEKTFKPLLQWLLDEMDLPLAVSDSFILSHPAETMPRAEQLLAEADDWELAALDSVTNTSKSLVIALAVSHGRISAEEATAAARVAEQFQTDEWGVVEAGHDLDAADVAVRIGASSAFLRMLGR